MLTDEFIDYICAVRRYSSRTQAIYREVLDGFATQALLGEASDDELLAALMPPVIRNYDVFLLD